MSRYEENKGLVIVNTGYGKGNTTAALGTRKPEETGRLLSAITQMKCADPTSQQPDFES